MMRRGLPVPYSNEDLKVAELAEALALACGTGTATASLIGEAAALHYVGKFRVSSHILNKPGKLSPCEHKAIKTHTIWGANMLIGFPGAVGIMARDIALYHHEKFDGTGYWGKRTNELPFYVHIATICDVYVALISSRPYKRGWASNEALDYIKTQAGKHFSPVLAHMFIKLMREQNGGGYFGPTWPEVRGGGL